MQTGWLAALLIVAMLVPVGAGRADEGGPRPAPEIRAPDSRPPLDDLIREGLGFTAHGNLDGASRSWKRIREHYPEHPAGPLYELQTLDVRKSLDVQEDRYEGEMLALAEEALAFSEAWLARVPDDPQAHYYAGQTKYHLMMLSALDGRYYRAGTNGEQSRKHLERALELDPTLIDAKLPLGSYYYYASIATRFIRWFTWLWFIPTGERDLGMAYVDEVRREGDLRRFEASEQMAEILLYLEEEPELAAPIVNQLHEAYPENSRLTFEVIELRMLQKDYEGTAAKALELEQSPATQFGDDVRRLMAKIWRARAELALGRPDGVGEILAEVEGRAGDLTRWCRRWLLLTRGNLEDVLGRRAEAVAYYERVIELKSRWESARSIELARQGLKEPFRPQAGEAGPLVGAASASGPGSS